MNTIQKHIQSLHKKISQLSSVDEKIRAIASYAKIITGARRCSIFIHKDMQLKSIYQDELGESIILPSNTGLVGYAFHKRESVLENDVSHNPNFFNAIDLQFNFTTRNILAVPIIEEDNHCIGVIQLLNKKMHFDAYDQEHIEALVPLISSILVAEKPVSQNEVSDPDKIQRKLGHYLDDKRLYLMDDGYAYYKILQMKRAYFISADTCYNLSDTPTTAEIFYFTGDDEFLSVKIKAYFDVHTEQIRISEKMSNEKFIYYPFEPDA